MPILSCADRIGLADGREECFAESLYLLNEDFVIVGLRAATDPCEPPPNIGDSFFTRFPASREERATLGRMLSSFSEDSLLMRAGKRPVMFLCQFFSRTRLLVAVVPEGAVRECLEAPAAYSDVLEALHLRLSGESYLLKQPVTEEGYTLLYEWLGRIHIPLFFHGRQSGMFDTAVATVATRVSHLAVLCGCCFSYDFTGFGYAPLSLNDFDLLMGASFAVLLAAHRAVSNHSLIMGGRTPLRRGTRATGPA